MATLKLTPDFREFLSLLNSEKIEYLLIGGYAVALYGFIRATKDIDIWVADHADNQRRLAELLVKFGFPPSSVSPPLFKPGQTVLRMGLPPNRLEVLTQIAGISFADCYPRRQFMEMDGVLVNVIDLNDLLQNKRSTGRASDRVDVERLEQRRP